MAGRVHSACGNPALNLLNRSGLVSCPDGAGAVGAIGRSVR
jgi:hypothetical protein